MAIRNGFIEIEAAFLKLFLNFPPYFVIIDADCRTNCCENVPGFSSKVFLHFKKCLFNDSP